MSFQKYGKMTVLVKSKCSINKATKNIRESKERSKKKTIHKWPHCAIREGNQDFGRPNIKSS